MTAQPSSSPGCSPGAKRHEFEANAASGAMQIVEVEKTVREVEREIERRSYVGRLLFAHLDDDYLMALGVPERWLDAVKATREDGLLHLFDHLPEEALENLLKLADGQPVPRPEAPSEDADPFEHPDAQRRFRVVGDDEEALQRALEQPRERWTVFLHPSQRQAVEKRYQGPAKVSGGAGTGKTVVALHRAATLARRGEGRVLLTTYTRTLARRLEQNLALLLGETGPARDRIEVTNLHKLARRLLEEQTGRRFRPLDDPTLRPILQRVARDVGSNADPELLLREWREVLDPHGITGLQAYLRVRRGGMGTPLQPAERIRLWKVFGPALEETRAAGLWSWDRLCHEAAALLEAGAIEPYRHVVADEVQDFGPAELRLLRALAPTAEDDLFLAGDVGQRIYQAGSSYARHGIEVRGRSTILRLNYRTTEQIRRYADALLPDALVTDDGEAEPRANVSLLFGPEPDLIGFLDVNDETRHLAERMQRWIQEGLEPGDIALFTRTNWLLANRALPAVELAGLSVQELDDDRPLERDAVAVGTMHRAKGLEFRAVIVIGAEDGTLPLRQTLLSYPSEQARESFRARERNLLYVACTRAREHLLVTWLGTKSEFLQEVEGRDRS